MISGRSVALYVGMCVCRSLGIKLNTGTTTRVSLLLLLLFCNYNLRCKLRTMPKFAKLIGGCQ